MAVTASTGIAACTLGGTTLHSFAGLGVSATVDPHFAAKKVRNNAKTCSRWTETKVLVIDEISMVYVELCACALSYSWCTSYRIHGAHATTQRGNIL